MLRVVTGRASRIARLIGPLPTGITPRFAYSRESRPVARITRNSGAMPSQETTSAASAPMTSSAFPTIVRSEEHTSELQSRLHLVCRLLLEKKKTNYAHTHLQHTVEHTT